MRRGKDDGDIICLRKGVGRGAQPQNLYALIFVLIGEVYVTTKDAQDLFLDTGLSHDLPEIVELIGEKTIQPATANRLHVLMAYDHRWQLRF